MNQKVRIGTTKTVVTVTDRQYKASGGEASIYVVNNQVFKLYHDPSTKMLPIQKIRELTTIKNPNVVIPQEVVYDEKSGDPLGYTTKFIDDAEPLLKFFTRTFKQDKNIDFKMIAELVKKLQLVTTDIHSSKCLIVDFNELNVLVNIQNELIPWFIDVDSYATPSFKATAIMDSVRDRRVSTVDKNGKLVYNPDILSDWFSWGVLSFWLYTNIHPFRGGHPNYKPKDKQKQMDDGISVFHQGVRVPPTVNNFNVIPKRHLDWFQAMFLKNDRSIPPLPDSIAPLQVPNTIVMVKGTNKLDVIQVDSFSENVINVTQFFGVNHTVTRKQVYVGQSPRFDTSKFKKVLVVPSADGTMMAATLSGTKVTFYELNTNKQIDTMQSTDIFARNNAVYTVTHGKLVENNFTSLGQSIIHRVTEVENVSNYSANIYEGCVIQDLLGKTYLTLPYKKGACFSKHIPMLDGYRVVEAKSEKTVTVVLAEKKGKYDRFVIVFTKDYSAFDVRKVEDVAYDTINFCVLDNGMCALLASPTELELFVSNAKVEVLNDPPIDSTMKLFGTTDGIFFISDNTVHQLKRK
jgi:hypothetical protein